MIVIENNEVYSTEGKPIKDLKTGAIIGKSQVLPTAKVEDYEELDEEPKYSEAQYKAKVQELIAEKYSIGDELALINNLKGDKDEYLIEYDEYMKYREECKVRAKEILSEESVKVTRKRNK